MNASSTNGSPRGSSAKRHGAPAVRPGKRRVPVPRGSRPVSALRAPEFRPEERRALELLAVRAFGSAEAIEGLAVDDTRSWRGR